MATCKDCICYDILCQYTLQEDELKLCESFKNKADVEEVKHGEWVHSSRGFDVDGDYECSMCHSPDGTKHFYGLKKYSFCPHCGAKMDGERRTDDE